MLTLAVVQCMYIFNYFFLIPFYYYENMCLLLKCYNYIQTVHNLSETINHIQKRPSASQKTFLSSLTVPVG